MVHWWTPVSIVHSGTAASTEAGCEISWIPALSLTLDATALPAPLQAERPSDLATTRNAEKPNELRTRRPMADLKKGPNSLPAAGRGSIQLNGKCLISRKARV